jgi:hypothetical protein
MCWNRSNMKQFGIPVIRWNIPTQTTGFPLAPQTNHFFDPIDTFSLLIYLTYEGVSKSFRTGRLERELQMVQLSSTRFSCIVTL